MKSDKDVSSDDDLNHENSPLISCDGDGKEWPKKRRPTDQLRGLAFGLLKEGKSMHHSSTVRSVAEICHILFSRGLATDMQDCYHIIYSLNEAGLIKSDDEHVQNQVCPTKRTSAMCCQQGLTETFIFADSVVNFAGDSEGVMVKLRASMQNQHSLHDVSDGAEDENAESNVPLEYHEQIVLMTCGRYVALRRSRSVCHFWEASILFLVGMLSWFTIWGIGLAGLLFAWWRDFGRRRAYLVLSGDGDEENPEMYGAEAFTIVPTGVITDECHRPQYGELVYMRSASTGCGVHAPRQLVQMGGNTVIRLTAEGKSGDIHIGDHVFVVTQDGAGWGWRTRTAHLDRTHYLATDAPSKIVFTLKKAPRQFDALRRDTMQMLTDDPNGIGMSIENEAFQSPRIAPAIPRGEAPQMRKLQISFIAYNVWMMPAVVTVFTQRFLKLSLRKKTRARIIPEVLPPVDVVMLSEAFCLTATPILGQGFKAAGYKFETPPLQGHRAASERTPLNGGVVVYSRFPIEWCKMVAFGEHSCGDDAMADKGLIYVKIRKHKIPVHVFATHAQAWNTEQAKEVRVKQFKLMRDLIKSLKIPATEPVIIGGDLNVDRYALDDGEEYDLMLKTLDANDACAIREPKTFSFDAVNNVLASSGPSSDGNCGMLDYILTSRAHLKPTFASVEVFPVKSPVPYEFQNKEYTDLSDHYPVIGHFTYDVPVPSKVPDHTTDRTPDSTTINSDAGFAIEI
eukprot:GEMP01006220.1.p1 GENE.GEMP01006220.1~~GEMP01006220.1.p1  ORF type:complete len:736 (+),score=134.55 GEMP01006220.1:316-2523(+)